MFKNKQKFKSSFPLANLSGNKRSATFTLYFLMLFLIRGPFLSTSSRLGRNLSKFLSTIKHPVIFCTLALPLSLSVSLAVLFPPPLPLPWPWLPGSWGLAKACVPEGASEEMERGGRAGAWETGSKTTAAAALPRLPLSCPLSHFTWVCKELAWHPPQLCH